MSDERRELADWLDVMLEDIGKPWPCEVPCNSPEAPTCLCASRIDAIIAALRSPSREEGIEECIRGCFKEGARLRSFSTKPNDTPDKEARGAVGCTHVLRALIKNRTNNAAPQGRTGEGSVSARNAGVADQRDEKIKELEECKRLLNLACVAGAEQAAALQAHSATAHTGMVLVPQEEADDFSNLVAAVRWILNDAAYKPPEEIGDVAQRWLDRLRSIDRGKEQ